MKLKFIGTLAAVLLASAFAFSQANSSAALPSAPGAANDPPAIAYNPNAKVAAININEAVFGTNEGQRAMEALQKKFDPKRTELNNQKGTIDALKKQQTVTGVTDERKGELQRQIDQKQKQLERDAQDAQEDYNSQQQEIMSRILQKMQPVIVKYIQDNNLGIVIDTSQPWPNGPVLYSAPLDITKPIVDNYNAQSATAAPAPGSGSPTKPAAPHATPGTKPATPPSK